MGEPLSEKERKAVADLLGSPINFPNRFKQWFIDYMAQNIPPLPIDHVEGYVKTRGYGDTAAPGVVSYGTGWLDLGGPDFYDIPGGVYLMLWGFFVANGVAGGIDVRMGPAVDGGSNPSEDQAAKLLMGSVGGTAARARVIEIGDTASGQGSLNFRYRADILSGGPGSVTVTNSWADVVRVG